MDYKELIATLRACSNKKGYRCSGCPAFGKGDRYCAKTAMKKAADALTAVMEENTQLRAKILDLEAQHRTELCESALYDCVELGKVRAELERVKRERDAAVALLREMNWCAGCIHFKGLKGCADNAMSVCDKDNDHYQFRGPQKEE